MKYLVVLLLSLAGGCASNSGVVPAGTDRFMISKQAATGFSGLGDMKAEALREADAHCRLKSRGMQVVSTNESKPPYIFGNFPRVEVIFTCTPN